MGFAWAWYVRQKELEAAAKEQADLVNHLKEARHILKQKDNDAQAAKLTIETLQKQNQTIENEVISLQSKLSVLQGEMKVLERENHLLTKSRQQPQQPNTPADQTPASAPPAPANADTPDDKDNELKLKMEEGEELSDFQKRIETARRLVNAFKKGALQEGSRKMADDPTGPAETGQ